MRTTALTPAYSVLETPTAVVCVVRALRQRDVQEKFKGAGLELSLAGLFRPLHDPFSSELQARLRLGHTLVFTHRVLGISTTAVGANVLGISPIVFLFSRGKMRYRSIQADITFHGCVPRWP